MAYETFNYINHLGETITAGQDNRLFVNENDLRDYSWDAITKGEKISGFEKKTTTKNVPLRIIGASEEDKNNVLNRLFQIGEKDVLANQYGRIYIGEYYLKCYITGSSKANYIKKALRYAEDDIQITTDYPWWIKEIQYSYERRDGAGDGDYPIVTTKRNLDYNFDYNLDYSSSDGAKTIYNTSIVPANFKIVIHGGARDPYIKINQHIYQIYDTLYDNERIEIDSATKKIRKLKYDGTWESAYSKRNKESYIFEKLASGPNQLIWDGTFAFDITIYDERSEPLWILI